MTPEMRERFRALADFMGWIDPEGYAEATAVEPCEALWAHCSLGCIASCDHDSPCPAHGEAAK